MTSISWIDAKGFKWIHQAEYLDVSELIELIIYKHEADSNTKLWFKSNKKTETWYEFLK